MRSTQTCPKCGGHKFAVSAEFRQPDAFSLTRPFPAISFVGIHQQVITSGRFEAWICLACGFTELYAYGSDNLEALAKQYPDHLRIVDARPHEKGPYR